jgi:hypothetical protein
VVDVVSAVYGPVLVADMSLFDTVYANGKDTNLVALPDTPLDEVESWFRAHGQLALTFATLIRRGLDEVIDGGRTGRWSLAQLEATEKTYIGTKMEILVRDIFELPREKPLDTVICGHPLDIKWSANRAGWQIPTEAIGHLCLLLSADEVRRTYEVGLVRCTEGHLNRGKNKDQKTTLSAEGRAAIRWLARGELPANFLATLPPAVRDEVMAQPKGQARVRKLFTLVQRTPVPRLAIVTVAQQPGDPMRRIRRDKGDRLLGLVVLGGHYKKTSEVVEALGYQPLAKDEYMSVPLTEIRAHGIEL